MVAWRVNAVTYTLELDQLPSSVNGGSCHCALKDLLERPAQTLLHHPDRHEFAQGSEIRSILRRRSDLILGAMADSALIFDTHEDIQELVNSGMPEPQAETVVRQRVRLLERNLATKGDIAAINFSIETLRQETKADIETLRQETKAGIETLRQETKAAIAATNASIETLRQETKAAIAATNASIETLQQETKAGIETLRQETKAGHVAATNASIETLRQETKAGIAATKTAAAGDRETDSPWQERDHQVGCRRQSRDCRHDRRRDQAPLIPLRRQ